MGFSAIGSGLHLGGKSCIATGPMPSTQSAPDGAWEVVRSTISISFKIRHLRELADVESAGIGVFAELVDLRMTDLTQAMFKKVRWFAYHE